MRKINAEIVLSNISEAREELEQIEALARSGEELEYGELVVMFAHAYRHMNWAWNARQASDEEYGHMTGEGFSEWSKFPTELEPLIGVED